jgi:hypothetical protein
MADGAWVKPAALRQARPYKSPYKELFARARLEPLNQG